MKKINLLICSMILSIGLLSSCKSSDTRDYNYERYCDSIFDINPDYYMDVLVETDEYQKYIKEHGEWW